MKENVSTAVTGGLFGLVLAAIIASWQVIVVVAIIYAIGLFANLVTGLLYAKQTKTYSQEKAEAAIYKKAGAIVSILALFALDLCIMGIAQYFFGLKYNIPFFGCMFTGYNAVHEYKSMIENSKKLGNKSPKIIDNAINKAEEALDQGKMPDLEGILKGSDTDENIQ
ncbi:MAG TPA: hypothetical protein GXX14_04675 [Clostridiaceae bacterium]|nr:hypothetical protein [Clostridiaceae bacterium]